MTTAPLHLSARIVLAAAAIATAVLARPDAAAAYGWPVKPFERQHPVRGFFGDPRIHKDDHALHFGVDISAPDGTPVYATASGPVSVHSPQRDVVSIRLADGSSLEYWHVIPAVSSGTSAVAYRTVIGRIGAGWGHVHLAEIRGGRYVNPLRPGALAPYADHTRPTVRSATFERQGRPVGRTVRGTIDLVADAFDETPLAVPAPWTDKPVTPALIKWRIAGQTGWRVATDFRTALPESPFESVYALWTRQNHPWSRGRYRFRLTADLDSRKLPDGRHRLQVAAVDTRGNEGLLSVQFAVANGV
jgi:hypothetical protein